MTREEALEALELTGTPTAKQIERAYETLYTEFQVRVDNAPTERLRERFRERLRTLEQAHALLLRCGPAQDTGADSIPWSEPGRVDPPTEEVGEAGEPDAGSPPGGVGHADHTRETPEEAREARGPGPRPSVESDDEAHVPAPEPRTPAHVGSTRMAAGVLALALLAVVGLVASGAIALPGGHGSGADLPTAQADSTATAVLRVTVDAEGVVEVAGGEHRVAPDAPARIELPAGDHDVAVRSAADSTVLVRHAGMPLEAGFVTALQAALADSLAAREAARTSQRKASARPRIEPDALHRALSARRIDELRRLLDAGADVNSLWGYDETPLHRAAVYGDREAVRLLLDRGADIHRRGMENYPAFGGTSLHLAATLGKNARDAPAQPASPGDYAAVVRLLLARGADPDAQASNKDTPLHVAAKQPNNLEMVRALIDGGARVDARNMFSHTPLYYVVQYGHHLPTARELLDRGADPSAAQENGLTPLHIVQSPEMLRLLLERGASTTAVDRKGNTPLAYLRKRNCASYETCKARTAELIRILEQAGAR